MQASRAPERSMVIINGQSVKTTEQRGTLFGYDGGKLVKGGKRFYLVDTLGLVISALVTAAKLGERVGAQSSLRAVHEYEHPRVETVLAERGYNGQAIQDYVIDKFGWLLECSPGPAAGQVGLVVQQWRLIVERTIGWVSRARRLSKEYEVLVESSVAMIQLTMSRLMLRRLTDNRRQWQSL